MSGSSPGKEFQAATSLIKQETDAIAISAESPKPSDPSKRTTLTAKSLPSKKRKVETSEDRATPTSDKRSPAPSKSTGKASSAGKSKKTASIPATTASSQPSDEDEGDYDVDEEQVYCICRKKDDHSWMIGCDGGCDDWYHGRCVSMFQRDEDLIDKFICPICSAAQGIKTTWKPMCRLEGCRRPARLKKGEESKYCSDACGLSFMENTMNRASLAVSPRKNRKAYTPVDPDIGPLGGPLRTHELKALADADNFRTLGSAESESPSKAPAEPEEDNPEAIQAPTYTEQEITRLTEIEDKKQILKDRRELIKARGQLVSMMRLQREKLAEKLKIKELCAFDRRWTMDDASFQAWRYTDEGKAAFESGSLEEPIDEEDATNNVCLRKRCERHRQWPKLVLQDVRFEEADVGNEMRRIDTEEKDIRRGAIQRARGLEKGVVGSQPLEGWAEKVPDILDIKMEDIV